MNNNLLEERIKRAQELLQQVRHAAMATVNDDGSPHNTPYFFMYNPELTRLYWGSHPDSQHSKNIERTGQIFVAVYDARVKGGLYFEAHNAHIAYGEDLDVAVAAHNVARARAGKTPPVEREFYERGPQKMYIADIKRMWVNLVEYNANGEHVRDYRHQISATDLL